MSEDAREIAQRIVREVLDAHGASEPPSDGVATAPSVDVTDATAVDTADRVADALDDSPARQTARRIVAEVLAAHAEASRSVPDLPVVAEAEEPGPASASPVLQPVAGRPAVIAGVPEDTAVADEDVAEDAVAIARRIVASVLAAHDDGPPPIPAALRRPVGIADEPPPHPVHVPALASDDPDPVADAPPSDIGVLASEVVDAAPVDEPTVGPPPTEPDVDPVEVHGSYALPPIVADVDPVEVHGSYALPPAVADPVEPTPHPLEDTLFDGPAGAGAPVAEDPVPAPDTTAVLPPDDLEDPDATTRVPVATLERESTPAAEDEPTLAIPAAAPPRRTGRWLLATILGAVALTILLPLAVEALRELVALS